MSRKPITVFIVRRKLLVRPYEGYTTESLRRKAQCSALKPAMAREVALEIKLRHNAEHRGTGLGVSSASDEVSTAKYWRR